MARLFDTERKTRRKTTKALVPVDSTSCPRCRSTLRRVVMDEPALFRHGGHGATLRTVTDHCSAGQCHWSMVRSVTESNPRREYAAGS